jgi:hypothetical protein
VGIAQILDRHGVAGDLAGRRVQLADHPVPVPGIPDHPLTVHDQVVRVRSGIDLEALELAAVRLEDADVVTGLTDEPDTPVGGDIGVTGPGLFPRNRPLADLDGLDRVELRRSSLYRLGLGG